MNLDGAQVTVVGMARSGVAAVELLLEKNAKVTAIDQKPVENERLKARGISVQPQTEAPFMNADLIVLSPGVPADLDEVVRARAKGVAVIGDLELASWFLEGDIIGITGANGKTTTTALTGHILKNCGISVQVGGNIGTPPCSMVVSSNPEQWNVLELSSFQLETTEKFHARIGAALNVTPDHLDRHYSLERYTEAKGRLFINQRAGDVAVLNADDPLTRGYAQRSLGVVEWFSSTRKVEPGAWLDRGQLILNGEPLMEAAEVPLRGVHNLENTMAAALMAHEAGAHVEQIRAAVMTFPGVEHRLEFVRELNGVNYYNDSKATNVDATLKALGAFPGGLWVILGGRDKDADYSVLAKPVAEKARGVLLIGATAGKIERQLNGAASIVQCGDLSRAVGMAFDRAQRGETVLLAPACASFDQFENFEHRGREFKRLVWELGG